MQNLVNYFQANPLEMSAADAEFASGNHHDDLVALATEEKEPIYKLIEKQFYWLFYHKAGAHLLAYPYTRPNNRETSRPNPLAKRGR